MNSKKSGPLKIVIIGGVAGGASAAAKARRMDETAQIVMIERGPFVSYANCGLPYHVSGEIKKRRELFVSTPERLKTRFNIDVRTRHEAVRIDRDRQVVEVRDLGTSRLFEESYDKLILATGAEGIVPPIPGIDAPGVFSLKTVEDMDQVIAFVKANAPRSAVVIGGGFIGIEAAEALRNRGIAVSIVEAAGQLLLAWDAEIADVVEYTLTDQMGVEVYTSDPVAAVLTDDTGITGVRTAKGEEIDADLVILAVGVRPRSQLARECGLRCTERGCIVTDDRMQTSDGHIFAVGDAVQTVHRVTGKPTWLPLAGPANRQGRVAAINATGGDDRFPGVIGTAIVRVGRLAAARTGLGETEAREAGLAFITTVITGKSHAGYFPGAQDVMIKLIVEQDNGRLLGAQAVGRDGVDKRIDVLATAIIGGLTVGEISDLELAYAPPFGAAKDPVNMAAMVAQNQLEGISETVTWREVFADAPGEETAPLILDVRTRAERKTLYIDGSELIPIDELRAKLSDLDSDLPIYIYCRIGQRGYFAEQMLRKNGFSNVKNIAGGWRSIWGAFREDKLIGQEPEPKD